MIINLPLPRFSEGKGGGQIVKKQKETSVTKSALDITQQGQNEDKIA